MKTCLMLKLSLSLTHIHREVAHFSRGVCGEKKRTQAKRECRRSNPSSHSFLHTKWITHTHIKHILSTLLILISNHILNLSLVLISINKKAIKGLYPAWRRQPLKRSNSSSFATTHQSSSLPISGGNSCLILGLVKLSIKAEKGD